MPKINAGSLAEHRQQTWDAILDAVESLAVERGPEALSLREVATRSGVSRTAIYNYAPDLTALLVAAAARGGGRLRAEVRAVAETRDQSATERVDRIVRLLILDLAVNTRAMMTLQALFRTVDRRDSREGLEPFKTEVGSHLRAVIDQGVDAGEFDAADQPELRIALIAGVVEAAVDELDGSRDHAEAVAESTSRFVLSALAGRRR